MEKSANTSPVSVRDSSFSARYDIPFIIMGLFFIVMAVLEYLFPEGSGSGRTAVKILCGTQITFSIIVAFFTRGYYAIVGWVPISFLLLCMWISFTGLVQTNNFIDTLYLWSVYFYWYSMFLFFYTRSRMHQKGVQGFLVLVVFSLLVWLLALNHSSSIIMKVRYNVPKDYLQQNYIGYYIVALFPYALMIKSRNIKIIAILLITYGVCYSLKRGAILAYALMGISTSVLYFAVVSNTSKIGKKLLTIIALWGVIIVVGGLFVYANKEAVDDRIGESSNREVVFSRASDAIRKSEIYEIIIGHGDRHSQEAIGGFTHNDWLLILYDYGIVGVLLMLNVYLSLMGFLRKLCRNKSLLSLPLASAFVLMFCVQQYSMGLQLKTFGLIVGSIGLVLGGAYAENSINYRKKGLCNPKFAHR